MKTVTLLMLSSLLALSVQAQTKPAKPGPEQKKLEVLAGDWKYTGTQFATPLGAAGKFAGTYKNRMTMNGFFIEIRWKDKGDYGDDKGVVTEGVEIDWYDSATKGYGSFTYEQDGAVGTGPMTIDGNTWRGTSTRKGSDGKDYQVRTESTVSEDGKRYTYKAEISVDGTKWIPWLDMVGTKVRDGR